MEIDKIIHEPARLRIMMILSGIEKADFNFIVSTLEMTRGNLSSHMDRLEQADYIEILKSFNGKMPNTSYRLTGIGETSLSKYWETLDEIKKLRKRKS
jgi:DNA-binding transcriptional ArsR family regulator